MRIYLLKDIEKVGLAGEIIKAADGFARNYLLPNKLGIEVTKSNEKTFAKRAAVVENRKEVIASKTSILAQKIASLTLKLKHKSHDDGKLFGSVSAAEIVDLLGENDITISKSQVEINKSIKTVGLHKVTIKLSSSLKPEVTLKVSAE